MLLLLFFMIVLGLDVALSMGCASVIELIILRGINHIPFDMIAQKVLYGVNNFTILAIPFFLFAGQLGNELKITERVFELANSLVGKWRGGLAHANVVASMVFAGMSGSAVADAGGLGRVEIEGMTKAGYTLEFSAAVTGASSTIGPIIPPSIPMVIYGALAGVSITKLFIGGVIPGIMMGIGMMVVTFILVSSPKTKGKVLNDKKSFNRPPFLKSLKKGILPLFAPIILVGGILSGFFTPTEAAAVTIVYMCILGIIYKTISFKGLLKVLKSSAIDTTVILFIVAASSIYSWILARYQVTSALSEALPKFTTSPFFLLIILNLILLVVGCFMDPTPALFILTPIFVPLVQRYGIDPTYFGVIMVFNLVIGLITPPVGTVLYTLQKITKLPFEKIVKAIIPFYIPLVLVLIIMIIYPSLVMFLPNLMVGR